MSGLEIVGLAASVIQIAELGGKLSVRLFTFSRKIKNAHQSIDSISQDIAATGAVLAQLGNELRKEDNLRLRSPAALATTENLVESCNKLFTELNEAIDGGESGHKLIAEFKKRLRFPFLEPQIELLRSNLERLKTSLLVILNVLILAEQLRSQKDSEILKDQHELLRTLIKEKDTSEQNYKRVLQAVEASKGPEGAQSDPDTCGVGEQDSASCNLLQANTQATSAASNDDAATSGLAVDLPLAIDNHTQLADHCLLIGKILQEIGVVKYRIDYGQRDRVQKAVLKVHWDEWTHLRKKHGDKRLLELFTALRQHEVAQYWRQTAETQEEFEAQQPDASFEAVVRSGTTQQSCQDLAVNRATSNSTIRDEQDKVESENPQSRPMLSRNQDRESSGTNTESQPVTSRPPQLATAQEPLLVKSSWFKNRLNSRVLQSRRMEDRENSIEGDDSDRAIKDLLSGLANETEIEQLAHTLKPTDFPTEAFPGCFCKGAVRLLSTNERDQKRAFSIFIRPLGFVGTSRCFECSGCNYQVLVPLRSKLGGNAGETEESFETTVRESRCGVRYKWAFLAKCHVRPSNATSMVQKNLGFRMFACIFCCAMVSAMGVPGKFASGGVPMFDSVDTFMEHLTVAHRDRGAWPKADTLTRMKCIVGRVARADEDWDINLPPLAVGQEFC
ncbi:uncharacterized protein Z519_00881 [Cladophialophora bantiana CBS 173.52]|uniref:Fungal N-terminal domain-containing protein n=1 Tax=Cladophialophora bantiana (strain ATCC 10958 / CBS 173.52 / CDC B-1940 / NIH 8579) TaxID=1442370 RepID=A0A0D2I0H0_CLAB1|nr:uncharacterized protein Z519_00881 [Cladophialophora bantiana CBS 173.52]KIW99218.1 hypothetical protein Z519_00881 [Cladophialophora bantiana CBS 173.52]